MHIISKEPLKSYKNHIIFAGLAFTFFVLSFGDCFSQSQFQVVVGDSSNTEEARSIIQTN